MYLYSIFHIFIYLIVQKILWMPCWVHNFWSLIFNTHGNWGCESNRPYVSGGVLIPFPSTLCRHSLRSAMSPFLLVQVLPLEEHGFGPQTSSSSPWKFTRPFHCCWKSMICWNIPPMDKENRLGLGICDRFPGGSLTRWSFEEDAQGDGLGLSRNTEAQIILTSNLAMATATSIKANHGQSSKISQIWMIHDDTVSWKYLHGLSSMMQFYCLSWYCSSMILFTNIYIYIPSKRHFWRWFSISQGGICHVSSWLICCQAATYAVGDAVNCRQVDVNVGVRTLSWRWVWIHLSNEKNPGCLGCIGDYTTQLYGDFNKPI